MPSDVAYATLMSCPDTALSDTVIVAVPAASETVTSAIVSDGAASSSVMVRVPVASSMVAPLTFDSVRVTVSSPS